MPNAAAIFRGPGRLFVPALALLLLQACGSHPGTQEDAEWKVYTAPDESFQARLPAPPQHKEMQMFSYVGKLVVHDWGYERSLWRGSFVISYCNIPPKATFDLNKGVNSIKDKLRGMGFTVQRDEPSSFRSMPARCLQLTRHTQSGEAIVFHTADTRVYTIIAVGGTPAERARFTSSFQWHLSSTRALDLALRPKIGERPGLSNTTPPGPADTPAEPPRPPPAPEPAAEPAPDNSWMDACLADLRGGNPTDATRALERCKNGIPERHKEEALRAVESLLLSPSANTRLSHLCLDVLETQATLTCVPALDKAIRSGESFIADRAMQLLGKLGSPDAFRSLARCLADPTLRPRASAIIKNAGPRAEPYLWGSLDDKDPRARAEACRLLGEIGSDNSLPRLQPLLADADPSVKNSAQSARSAITGRKGKAPATPLSAPTTVPGKKWY